MKISHVSGAVKQMDTVVQQNASLVEEAAAATESMKDQAGTLLDIVSRFRVAEGAQPAMLEPAPAIANASPVPIRTRTRADLSYSGGGWKSKRKVGDRQSGWQEF